MIPACRSCVQWKHRYDDPSGRGRGTCWHEVPAVMTHEDDQCEHFVDRLANRTHFEAQQHAARRMK